MDGIIDSMDMSLIKVQKIVTDREACGAAVHEVSKSWTQLSDCTATIPITYSGCSKITLVYLHIYWVLCDSDLSFHLTITGTYFDWWPQQHFESSDKSLISVPASSNP